MHELSYMIKFIDMAHEAVKDIPDPKVKEIRIRVGAMTGVLPEYLHKYFPKTVKGTVFEGAALDIEEVPVEALCEECGAAYTPSRDNDYACPKCHGINARIVRGRELELKEVVIYEMD